MTKRRSRVRFSAVMAAALALTALPWTVTPVGAADQQPMPRMTHAQRQAAAAARKEKIKAMVEAQQAAIKAVEQQQGQPGNEPASKPQIPAGSGK